MKDEEFRNNLKWIAASGAIERYPVPVISDRLKRLCAAAISGAFVGFILGFCLGVQL